MSARLALAVAVVVAAGTAHAQPSQDGGLHVETVSSPSPGGIQVLLSADARHDTAIGKAPAAKDFTLWLGTGAAPGVTVARNGGRGPLTTVVLVDESASYKLGVGAAVAVPAITAYAKEAGTDELALVAFSLDTTAFPVRAGAAPFLVDLAAKRKPGQATSVTIGLAAAIKLAAVEGAPGLREVIVFTDAGDEAEVDKTVWAKIIAQARDAGVRVSVVLPTDDKKPTGTKHEVWVTTTTNLNRLATETAGTFVTNNDPLVVAKALGESRTRLKSWLVLDAKLCGARSNQPVDVRVEYVPKAKREAWSAGARLDAAAWAPGADAPCPSLCKAACDPWAECLAGECQARSCTSDAACAGGAACLGGVCAKRCTRACAAWEDCTGGACVARVCKSDEACGVGSHCKSGACQPPMAKSRMLIWVLAGAGALLLLAALVVLLRKKAPLPLVTVVEPEPLPPEPIVEASAPVDLDPLPETHLVAIGGWATQGERWRLHKRKTVAGGSADPGDGVDLVFAVNQISSRHAQLELFPSGDLWIADLGSTNGTFVNGKRLAAKERAKLVVGDQVKLSQNLTLVVERPGEVAAAKPPAEEPAPEPAKKKAKQKTRFDPGNR
ncbi:MAG: FHA domain-containing protein [Polyangiales bacterium]